MFKFKLKYFFRINLILFSAIYIWGIVSFEVLSSAHYLSHYFSDKPDIHKVHDLIDHFEKNLKSHKHKYLSLLLIIDNIKKKANHHSHLITEIKNIESHLIPNCEYVYKPAKIKTFSNLLLKKTEKIFYDPAYPPPKASLC